MEESVSYRSLNIRGKTLAALVKDYGPDGKKYPVFEIAYKEGRYAGGELDSKTRKTEEILRDWFKINKSGKYEIVQPRNGEMMALETAREVITTWEKLAGAESVQPAGKVKDDITKIVNLDDIIEAWDYFQTFGEPEKTLDHFRRTWAYTIMRKLEKDPQDWVSELEMQAAMTSRGSSIRTAKNQETRTILQPMADFLGISRATSREYFATWACECRMVYQVIKDWTFKIKFQNKVPMDTLLMDKPWDFLKLPGIEIYERGPIESNVMNFVKEKKMDLALITDIDPVTIHALDTSPNYRNIKGQKAVLDSMVKSKEM